MSLLGGGNMRPLRAWFPSWVTAISVFIGCVLFLAVESRIRHMEEHSVRGSPSGQSCIRQVLVGEAWTQVPDSVLAELGDESTRRGVQSPDASQPILVGTAAKLANGNQVCAGMTIREVCRLVGEPTAVLPSTRSGEFPLPCRFRFQYGSASPFLTVVVAPPTDSIARHMRDLQVRSGRIPSFPFADDELIVQSIIADAVDFRKLTAGSPVAIPLEDWNRYRLMRRASPSAEP